MSYPEAKYETGEPVLIGDHVGFRMWSELWLKKCNGRVEFVPGISPFNDSLEDNDLKWVSVVHESKAQIGFVVNPDSGVVKGLRFVRRTDDDFRETSPDFVFDESDGE